MKLHKALKKSFLRLFDNQKEFDKSNESIPEEPDIPDETLRNLAEMNQIREHNIIINVTYETSKTKKLFRKNESFLRAAFTKIGI